MKLDFSFQAEDGIRDLTVTGVQTCALPISRLPISDRLVRGPGGSWTRRSLIGSRAPRKPDASGRLARLPAGSGRSEERRGGEEGRCRGVPDHLKKKKKGFGA